jgi:hypothetical protein
LFSVVVEILIGYSPPLAIRTFHKALTKLLGLGYKIVYKQGKENWVANALSRTNHATDHEIAIVSVVTSPRV